MAAASRKALAAARSSSWLGVPPNGGPFLRLTSGLHGQPLWPKEWPRQDRRSIGAKGRRWEGPRVPVRPNIRTPYPMSQHHTRAPRWICDP